MNKKPKGCLHGIFKFFGILLCIGLVLTILYNVVFRAIYVDGDSMLPTLETGDWIVTCRLMKPKRGDIVVTNTKNSHHSRFIKRVIAFSGETVDIDFDTGTVYINGEPLDEPYIQGVRCVRGDVEFPVVVPEGKLFLLGDNRSNSLDSRYSEVGFFDEDIIIGPMVTKLMHMPFSLDETD